MRGRRVDERDYFSAAVRRNRNGLGRDSRLRSVHSRETGSSPGGGYQMGTRNPLKLRDRKSNGIGSPVWTRFELYWPKTAFVRTHNGPVVQSVICRIRVAVQAGCSGGMRLELGVFRTWRRGS